MYLLSGRARNVQHRHTYTYAILCDARKLTGYLAGQAGADTCRSAPIPALVVVVFGFNYHRRQASNQDATFCALATGSRWRSSCQVLSVLPSRQHHPKASSQASMRKGLEQALRGMVCSTRFVERFDKQFLVDSKLQRFSPWANFAQVDWTFLATTSA